MENEENGHDGAKVEELPCTDLPAPDQDDGPISLIDGKLDQDGAPAGYRLQREAKEEARQYAQSDIDRLMGAFDAWLADLQAAFSNRVVSKLVAYAIQEILRVWESASSNGTDRVKEPTPNPWVEQTPIFIGEESDPTSVAELRANESNGVGDTLERSAAEQTTLHPANQVENGEQEDSQVLLWAAKASEVLLYGNQPSEEQSAGVSSGDDNGARHETDSNADNGVYQGSVQVRVKAGASVQLVAQFLRELRGEEEILMQQMVNDKRDGTHIWLGLRKPLRLKETLLQMESVSVVERSPWLDQDISQPSFDVQLVVTQDN